MKEDAGKEKLLGYGIKIAVGIWVAGLLLRKPDVISIGFILSGILALAFPGKVVVEEKRTSLGKTKSRMIGIGFGVFLVLGGIYLWVEKIPITTETIRVVVITTVVGLIFRKLDIF